MATEDDVREEIERLHRFFVAWFAGTLPAESDAFDREFLDHCAPEFTYIMPGGTVSTLSEIGDALRGVHGSNERFRIQIREVAVRWERGDLVCATYQEWQRNAKASKPADNGRVASVLFRRGPRGLRWAHLHETWLPPEVVAAGPFDF